MKGNRDYPLPIVIIRPVPPSSFKRVKVRLQSNKNCIQIPNFLFYVSHLMGRSRCIGLLSQSLRQTFQTLRDSDKRDQYDMGLNRGSKEDLGSNFDAEKAFRHAYKAKFSDSFHKIFLEVDLSLSFSEAAKGCTKDLAFDTNITCDSCYGRGYPLDAKSKICASCRGIGKVVIPPFSETCIVCKGMGRIVYVCRGHQIVEAVAVVFYS